MEPENQFTAIVSIERNGISHGSNIKKFSTKEEAIKYIEEQFKRLKQLRLYCYHWLCYFTR